MSDYCFSLTGIFEGEYQEKGSKFLAYAFPCHDEPIFFKQLAELKKNHTKARHYCYVWRFGEHGDDYRVYDDGEPSGTAGMPIYNQMRAFEISNCGVIVARYFGGTLLGASGLIRAYKTATKRVLEKAELVRIVPQQQLTAIVDYADMNTLMNFASRFDYEVISRDMQLCCKLILKGPRDNAEKFREALLNLHFQVVD